MFDIKSYFVSSINKAREFLANNTIDYAEQTNAFVKVYKNLLTMIFFAVLIISASVLFFVQFLTVRTMLEKKKKDFGILKSTGYTTSDLIKQTIVSFVPSLVIGMLVGVVLGYFLMDSIFSISMHGIGIYKCGLTMPFWGTLLGGVGLALLSVFFVLILSQKIKKINPYELLIAE